MKYEYEKKYSQALGGNGTVTEAYKKGLTKDMAEAYMAFLETVYGLQRHETSTHYFYNRQLNCHETEEYRFWK